MFNTPTGWEILLKNEAQIFFEELGSEEPESLKPLNPNQNQKFSSTTAAGTQLFAVAQGGVAHTPATR